MAADVELVMVVFWEVEEVMLVAGGVVYCEVDFVARSLVPILRERYVGREGREERLACSCIYMYMDFSNMSLYVTQEG